jgi:hypothetical protein
MDYNFLIKLLHRFLLRSLTSNVSWWVELGPTLNLKTVSLSNSPSLICLPLSPSPICLYLSLTFSHISSFYYFFIDFLFEKENERIQPPPKYVGSLIIESSTIYIHAPNPIVLDVKGYVKRSQF